MALREKMKELRDKRLKLVNDMRALGAKGIEKLTGEEKTQFDRMSEEEAGLKSQIDDTARQLRLQELGEVEDRSGRRRVNDDGDAPAGPNGPTDDDGDDDDGEYRDVVGRLGAADRMDRRSLNSRHPRSSPAQLVQRDGRPSAITWRTAGGCVREMPIDHRGAGGREYARRFSDYLRFGERRGLLEANIRRPQANRDGWEAGDGEARSMQVDIGTEGGFLVPTEMLAGIIRNLDDALIVRQLGTVLSLRSSAAVGAIGIETDPSDAEWTGEITAAPEDNSFKLNRRELRPYPLAKLIKVSRRLLRLGTGVEALVQDRVAHKLAVPQEKAFMTGDGADKPLGLFTASSAGVPTSRDVSTGNTTTTITADNLLRCKYTLKAGYRNRPTTRWIMHRDTILAVSLLKDGNGQYLWQPSISDDQPDRLLGIAVAESEYAPNTFTTGLYVALLGDISQYYIAETLSMEMQRLDELYAATNQVGFIARAEVDGMPALAEAFVRSRLA